jgi:AAA domain-containing protein
LTEALPHHIGAAIYIRSLLDGSPPNGASPEAFGDYRDLIDVLQQVHAAGGLLGVRDAWAGVVRRRPDLAALVSEDHPTSAGWRVFTLTEAYHPRPPLVYVVEGLFPLPSLSIVYGPPGVLKSLLLADLMVCVAAGLPWLEPLPQTSGTAPPKPTQQAPGFWADFDNGIRRTHERFAALARARHLPDTTPLTYVSMPSPWLDAGKADTMRLFAECIHAQVAKLVIVDNLSAVKGEAEENSAEMGAVMAAFRRLAEDAEAAVILIHHPRKESGPTPRAGDRLRGHSAIEAAIDLALLVERDAHADTLTLQSTKVRGMDVPPFGALFSYEHHPGTTELATARFFGRPVQDTVSDRAIEQAIIEMVKAHPLINKTELGTKVKAGFPEIGMNRIGAVVERLAQQKKLKSKPGDRGAKRYEVP